jgi:hypothetical protein
MRIDARVDGSRRGGLWHRARRKQVGRGGFHNLEQSSEGQFGTFRDGDELDEQVREGTLTLVNHDKMPMLGVFVA